jgi:hypothetical protein
MKKALSNWWLPGPFIAQGRAVTSRPRARQVIRTSCRHMMALMSGVLKICVRALGTRGPNCIDRPARFFFMLEAYGPQGATGDAMVAPEP